MMPATMWDVLNYLCPVCNDDDFESGVEIAVHERGHYERNEVQGDPLPGLTLITPDGDTGTITDVKNDVIYVLWDDDETVGKIPISERYTIDI